MISTTTTGKCIAIFDFEGQEGALSFVEHELIETPEKVDDDWMKGRIGEREGIFPSSFVKVISDAPIEAEVCRYVLISV